jgi:hypothetical protein
MEQQDVFVVVVWFENYGGIICNDHLDHECVVWCTEYGVLRRAPIR